MNNASLSTSVPDTETETVFETSTYRVFQKELYNFESLYKCI
jgi:hypothetical protein